MLFETEIASDAGWNGETVKSGSSIADFRAVPARIAEISPKRALNCKPISTTWNDFDNLLLMAAMNFRKLANKFLLLLPLN